jgi:hypothetical protein
MAFTFANAQSKLSRLIGDSNTSTDDPFPLADRKKELNRGEVQFAKDTKMLLKKATGTVSSQTIAIPSDWLETHVLVVNDDVFTNDREISLTEWERYKDAGGDWFYLWGDTSGDNAINFLTANQDSKSYALYYFYFPTTELDADGDISEFPEFFREASVYYAASEFMDQIGKTQLSLKHRQAYEALVQEGMVYAERRYMNKQLARPDIFNNFEDVEEPQVDIQGKWPSW